MADETIKIKIQLTPESQQKVVNLAKFPNEVPQAIRRGMDTGLRFVAGRIQEKRLTGTGPFPVSQHQLGTRSGLLRRSVYTTPAIVQGNKVVGEIGSSLDTYAPIHEYGKTIRAKNAPFLVFKIGNKVIRTKQVIIPERAPFRTELETPETAKLVSDEINAAIQEAWSKL
jgi:hypothetical protein